MLAAIASAVAAIKTGDYRLLLGVPIAFSALFTVSFAPIARTVLDTASKDTAVFRPIRATAWVLLRLSWIMVLIWPIAFAELLFSDHFVGAWLVGTYIFASNTIRWYQSAYLRPIPSGTPPGQVVPGETKAVLDSFRRSRKVTGAMREHLPTVRTISLVAIVIVWLGMSMYGDYRWAGSVVKEKSRAGWVVVAKTDNLIDLTRPWTIVRQPINSLWFIRPNEIVGLSGDLRVVQTLSVHQERDSVLGYESASDEIINCSNHTETFLDKHDHLNDLDLSRLQWHKFDAGTPGAQEIDFVCRSKVVLLTPTPTEAEKIVSAQSLTCADYTDFDDSQKDSLAYGYLEGLQADLEKDEPVDILVPPSDPRHPMWWVLPSDLGDNPFIGLAQKLKQYCQARDNRQKELLNAFLDIAAARNEVRRTGYPDFGISFDKKKTDPWKRILGGEETSVTCSAYIANREQTRQAILDGYYLGSIALKVRLKEPGTFRLSWPSQLSPQTVRIEVDERCQEDKSEKLRLVLWLATTEMAVRKSP